MTKFLVPAAVALSLIVGSTAVAATKPAAPAPSAASAKAADCAKQWKAEKKHTQTHKAFMAACEKA
jgi:hypothetical protein